MKILFYGAKSYDKRSFESQRKLFDNIYIDYLDAELNPITATLSKGYDAVCAFVNADLSALTLEVLYGNDIHLVLLRCAGYNNVNIDIAKDLGITVARVPSYSPEAIAEHAMSLALAASRHICKGYNRLRENDFSLDGLLGPTLHGKVAGIVGSGKIGAAMCRICRGFGMDVIVHDVYENPDLDFVEYVSLHELFERSDLISLHCPLFEENYHLINNETISLMKDGVIFVNTARGGLVDTQALIDGIRSKKIAAVGLDVYEEETNNAFIDRSNEIIDTITAQLLSFPNVVMTSHQAFLTYEALVAIAHTTLDTANKFSQGERLSGPNIVI